MTVRILMITALTMFAGTATAGGQSTEKNATKTSASSAETRMDQWKREGRRMNFIADHDHDGDGRVSSIEFEQSRRDRFDATDSNTDGTVDEQEYVYEWEDRLDAQLEIDRSGRAKQTYVRFAAMDKDDDELMSWDEYAASGNRIFTGWDTNKDGVIDSADPERSYNWSPKPDSELTAEELEQRRERKMSYARSMLVMPTTHNLEGVMARYDLDQDGRVERDEFDGKRRADYDLTDFNGDGTLEPDEYASEFEDRMDAVIETFRAESVQQSRRRFEALDNDEDGRMTFAEYRESGNKIFARYDGSQDGYVSLDDPMPPRFEVVEDKQLAASNGD
ncbi:MAG: hypothetical protein AAF578_07385 [Pseudomonadota bacterium]